MYLEIDEVKCENIDRIEFDDVAMEIVLTDEKVYERIKRWLKSNEIDYDCREDQYFANLIEGEEHESVIDRAIALLYTKLRTRDFEFTDEERELLEDAFVIVSDQ